jgi:hypothetical protein
VASFPEASSYRLNATEMPAYARRRVWAGSIQWKMLTLLKMGSECDFGACRAGSPLPSSLPECPLVCAMGEHVCGREIPASRRGYPQPGALRRLNVLVKVKQLAARKAVDYFLESDGPCA